MGHPVNIFHVVDHMVILTATQIFMEHEGRQSSHKQMDVAFHDKL